MVSLRCKSRCLLNHCKQIGKPSDLSVEYMQRKNYSEELDMDYSRNPLAWVCIMSFSNQKYVGCHLTKKGALLSALVIGEEHLRSSI